MIITQNVSQRIPEALRAERRWIVHRNKLPVDPFTGRALKRWQKPAAWMGFDEALAHVEAGRADGVGFVFADNDTPFVGVDLDNCMTGEGYPSGEAEWVLGHFTEGAYIEKSPSGAGLHVIVRADVAKLPGGRRKFAINLPGLERVEFFITTGYLTFTGDKMEDTFASHVDYTETVRKLIAHYEALEDAQKDAERPARRSAPVKSNGHSREPLEGPITPEDVESALRTLSPYRADDYDDWIRIGTAVKAALGDAGFPLWHRWSQQSPKYVSERDCATHWRSFDASRVGPGTLFYLAKADNPDWVSPSVAEKVREKKARGNGNRRQYAAGEGRRLTKGGKTPTLEDLAEAYARHEVGDAELLARLYRGRAVYDHSEGAWYFWTGHYWQRDEEGRAFKMANDVAAVYLRAAAQAREEADDKREAQFIKRAGRLRFKSRIKNVLELAAADLAVRGEVWDARPDKLAVLNGVLDLRTGALEPGNPEDYIRTVAPVTWQGLDAPAPRWERFILEIFDGDKELATFVQRLLGYGVTGHRREAVLPILWGKGRNGKDTLLETLAHVLGDMGGPVSSAVLIQDRHARANAATPHLIALRNLRLAWVNETREGERLDAGQVKNLTGGGRITARPLYGKPVTFEPQHLLMLITNRRPRADADDYALWKRILLVPFTLSFVDNPTAPHERQRDPNLLDKLKAEAPGVLAWLVRGAMAWYREGLNPPDSVRIATEHYRDEEDVIGSFIEEMCIQGAELKTKAGDLYNAYKTWAKDYGLKPMSTRAFGDRISKRYTKRKEGYVYYFGIGLLD